MAISYHQEIVVQYLSSDPRLFISEEYYVGWGKEAKGEHIWVDVVAVDICNKEVFLVEITSDPYARQIIKKLNLTYSTMLPTVRTAMLGGLGLPDDWSIRPWIFVRREAVSKILDKIDSHLVPKITHLEMTAWEWEYKPLRREGAEPGKPYPDLDPKYQ